MERTFPRRKIYTNITYPSWTYGDLIKLPRTTTGRKYRIPDFKVGTLVVGWNNIYDGEILDFAKVHPNLFLAGIYSGSVRTVNLEAVLKADPRKFGSFPEGIPEGNPVYGLLRPTVGTLAQKLRL
jgi:hypothetical protein